MVVVRVREALELVPLLMYVDEVIEFESESQATMPIIGLLGVEADALWRSSSARNQLHFSKDMVRWAEALSCLLTDCPPGRCLVFVLNGVDELNTNLYELVYLHLSVFLHLRGSKALHSLFIADEPTLFYKKDTEAERAEIRKHRKKWHNTGFQFAKFFFA